MFAYVARSFSQVVLGLPMGLVPCRRPIIRSSVMRRPWKVSRLKESGLCVGPVKHLPECRNNPPEVLKLHF